MCPKWNLITSLTILIVVITVTILTALYMATIGSYDRRVLTNDAYTVTMDHMEQLSYLCSEYNRLNGFWPNSSGALTRIILITNSSIFNDAWGNPIVFRVATNPNPALWLISYGADGKPGGNGTNADITWWNR